MVTILFEDNHLIAAVKQSGQTVQPEPGKPPSLEEEVKEYIQKKYQKPCAVFLGVIHRLDMPVGGVVLFARTSKALTRMNEIFQQRKVRKEYCAWVEGKPIQKEATLEHWLRRDEKKNFTRAYEYEVKGADRAVLSYLVVKTENKQTLLQIQLHTGRKHQIRAQLSAMGNPIVGNMKYGAQTRLSNGAIMLQSCLLAFEHPVKAEEIVIELPQGVKYF